MKKRTDEAKQDAGPPPNTHKTAHIVLHYLTTLQRGSSCLNLLIPLVVTWGAPTTFRYCRLAKVVKPTNPSSVIRVSERKILSRLGSPRMNGITSSPTPVRASRSDFNVVSGRTAASTFAS